jgi:hypothetical protein
MKSQIRIVDTLIDHFNYHFTDFNRGSRPERKDLLGKKYTYSLSAKTCNRAHDKPRHELDFQTQITTKNSAKSQRFDIQLTAVEAPNS